MPELTLYNDEHVLRAWMLCARGATDEQVAASFGVDLGTIAAWAWEHKAFYEAITPSARLLERRAKRKVAYKAKAAKAAATPAGRLTNSTRARIWAAIKGKSAGRLFSRLGYSADELVSHIGGMLKPGMSFSNYGKWHIDHIRPCDSFDLSDAEQFAQCWALSNLQPLWASDNVRKGAKWLN